MNNGAVLLLIIYMSVVFIDTSFAQTATITGTVRDAETGETLPGANVTLEETNYGTSTDNDGRYTIRRVPAGSYSIVISFMGYQTNSDSISIDEDERLVLNFDLVGAMIEGDEVFVRAHQRGQARSLTRQRESINIRNVISSEQIDRFADQTVSGALQRVTGMGHGGANIRGIGAGASNVTMDGQRMGSTSGDRRVDLGTISADMVQEMDVIKVITPDMDADALSGVINISTRRPVGGERDLNARLGGGWNSRFGNIMGPTRRVSFSYGESPNDYVSYAVNLSYQRGTSSSERIETNWGNAGFDDYGARTVLTRLRTQMRNTQSDRYGAAFQFTLQPTDRSTFHFQSMFNYQDSERNTRYNHHSPSRERYIDPWTTGGTGWADAISNVSDIRDSHVNQYNVQLGGRHLFDAFDMEFNLGWGHGRAVYDSYEFPFRTRSYYDYSVNLDDRWHPRLDLAPHSTRSTMPDFADYDLGLVDHRWNKDIDNEFTGTLDFEIPFERGSIKLGSSMIMRYKDGNSERFRQEYSQRQTLDDFPVLLNADWNIFGRGGERTYNISPMLDLHKMRDWAISEYPYFELDMETWAATAETEYYSANENIYAAYGMGSIDFGNFRFLGGIRVEHTSTNYDARDGTIDTEGNFRGAVDTSAVHSYTNFFPNAQVVYSLTRMTNIRLAYSRSIGRPNFNQLSPYVLRDRQSENLTHGNPELKSMVSDNFDLLFEHYFMDVGQLSIGFYYKDLDDFVFTSSEIIHPDGIDGEGLYAGWRRRTYENGETAIAYGTEISWQQSLHYLPWFLGNTGIYVNYSYANSEAEVEGRRGDDYNEDEPPRLQDQRPHVVNLGLNYSQGAFSGQLSYHWATPSISSYGERRRVPEIDPNKRVWYDAYDATSSDISVTIRYRITDNFRLWFDGSNLLNQRSISYFYDQDLYPRYLTRSGRRFDFGIRYTF